MDEPPVRPRQCHIALRKFPGRRSVARDKRTTRGLRVRHSKSVGKIAGERAVEEIIPGRWISTRAKWPPKATETSSNRSFIVDSL
jgi:hypothetical protein